MKGLFRSKFFRITAVIGLLFLAGWILLALFAPYEEYNIKAPVAAPDSKEFATMIQAVADARLQPGNHLQVIENGDNFYPAELAAIAQAQRSVDIEAYIFHKGEIAEEMVNALTERARAGVKVRMVIDAMGTFRNSDSYFRKLKEAGGEVRWYHALRWYSWDRFNNRTHRELMVIDGSKGFIGGAGFDDHWLKDQKDEKRWRDTVVYLEGPAVTALQGTFVENWLESSGELLTKTEEFPAIPASGDTPSMVVNSSASAGRSTRARYLFQTLMASARKSIYVQTPYFLPDKSARQALTDAVKRGVEVKVITAGRRNDHMVTRSSSRRLYGDLLQGGVKIYEYQPAMMHAKVMIVDELWTVVGSTNMDNRSFELNDEVNLASYDGEVSRKLTEDFRKDLASSKEVTYEEWKRRPLLERFSEEFGWLIERQQ